jgi:hypothetical protein
MKLKIYLEGIKHEFKTHGLCLTLVGIIKPNIPKHFTNKLRIYNR